eukprot:9915514-Alexandrium_andersonii.AAC.1
MYHASPAPPIRSPSKSLLRRPPLGPSLEVPQPDLGVEPIHHTGRQEPSVGHGVARVLGLLGQ